MTRIGILGYGNLGRGVEYAVEANEDLELVAVFTRRAPASVKVRTHVPVVSVDEAAQWKDKVDVLILCGGSATDLPEQTPAFAKLFNVVDSFDTHAKIPAHFAAVDAAAKAAGHVGVISVGWDPGMFSLARVYGNAVLTNGADYTFWGRGVSQGHSDAIRRVPGVKDAKQYTVPVPAALEAAKTLAAKGVSCEVINMATVKPLDEDLIVTSARKTGRVVTVEEHSVIGGLGSAVCDLLCEACPTPVKKIGVNDVFGESGPALNLLAKYGLDGAGVAEAIEGFVR